MESKITIFENNNIRRIYDEKSEKWYFSVGDKMPPTENDSCGW